MKFNREMFASWKNFPDEADITGIMAGLAQAAFDSWLREQPVVYGRPVPTGESMRWSGYRFPETTYTAHLVGIKRIGEDG